MGKPLPSSAASLASRRRASTSAPRKAASTRGKQKPTVKSKSRGKVPPLLKAAPKKCLVCNQTTHDFENDTEEFKQPTYLKWRVVVTVKKTPRVVKAKGNECWYCYDTRRRFFEDRRWSAIIIFIIIFFIFSIIFFIIFSIIFFIITSIIFTITPP